MMHKQALKGCEKALGSELITTYTPALNTTQNLAVLYARMDRVDDARELYRRALHRLESVFCKILAKKSPRRRTR